MLHGPSVSPFVGIRIQRIDLIARHNPSDMPIHIESPDLPGVPGSRNPYAGSQIVGKPPETCLPIESFRRRTGRSPRIHDQKFQRRSRNRRTFPRRIEIGRRFDILRVGNQFLTDSVLRTIKDTVHRRHGWTVENCFCDISRPLHRLGSQLQSQKEMMPVRFLRTIQTAEHRRKIVIIIRQIGRERDRRPDAFQPRTCPAHAL